MKANTNRNKEQAKQEAAIDFEALSTKDIYQTIVYQLWTDYITEIETDNGEGKAEINEVMDHFAEIAGVKPRNALALMYGAFYAGVGKGLELGDRINKTPKEDSSH